MKNVCVMLAAATIVAGLGWGAAEAAGRRQNCRWHPGYAHTGYSNSGTLAAGTAVPHVAQDGSYRSFSYDTSNSAPVYGPAPYVQTNRTNSAGGFFDANRKIQGPYSN